MTAFILNIIILFLPTIKTSVSNNKPMVLYTVNLKYSSQLNYIAWYSHKVATLDLIASTHYYASCVTILTYKIHTLSITDCVYLQLDESIKYLLVH